MKKQYGIKVDIIGDEDYELGAWLEESMDIQGFDRNPTSALRNVTITKNRNTGQFSADLVMAPDRDNEGKTWEDRLNLFDVVYISLRTGSVNETKEDLLFFGWITSIQYSLNIQDNITHDISVTCESIGTFMESPFLAFSQITDAVSSVYSTDLSLWKTLASSDGNVPTLIKDVLASNFFSFISNMTVDANKKSKLTDYIGYYLVADSDILPFVAGMINSFKGQNSTFLASLKDILEINGDRGWLHELYIDIISESKLKALKEVYGKTAEYITPAPIPVKGSLGENFYLMVVARPNPFPYLKPSEGAKGATNKIGGIITATSEIETLMKEGDVSLESTIWDRIKSKVGFLSHSISEDLQSISPTRDEALTYTTFLVSLDKELDSAEGLVYNLPSIADLTAYKRRGYKPMHIKTKYAQAKVETGTEAKDKKDRGHIMKNLIGLTFKLASFAGLGTLYRQGTLSIALNPDISIGDIIEVKALRSSASSVAYVTGVTHVINPMSKGNHTSVRFSRMLQEESGATNNRTYTQILEKQMRARYYLSSTVNQRTHLLKRFGIDTIHRLEGKNAPK